MDYLAKAIRETDPATCDEKFIASLHMITKTGTFSKKTQLLAQNKLDEIGSLVCNDKIDWNKEFEECVAEGMKIHKKTIAENKDEVEIILENIQKAMSEIPEEALCDLNVWNCDGTHRLDEIMEKYYGITKKPKDKN